MKKQKNVNFSPRIVPILRFYHSCFPGVTFTVSKCAVVYDIAVMEKGLYLMEWKVDNPNKN